MVKIDRQAFIEATKRSEIVVRSIATPDGYTGKIVIDKTVDINDDSLDFIHSPYTKMWRIEDTHYMYFIALTGNESIIVLQVLNF